MSDPDDQREPGLSAETIDEIKGRILFGTGYKRPPKHTQFRKGQSGNPEGRPKIKLPSPIAPSSKQVLAEARRQINVREGEETRKIPSIEAVLRSQYVAAMKGNAYAQKHILELLRRVESEQRSCIDEQVGYWREYVAAKREEIAAAKARGETLPNPVPHPDHVIIDPTNGVRFIGPENQHELDRHQNTLKWIDTLLMQHVLDKRLSPGAKRNDVYGSSGALKLATEYNGLLPEALRLSEARITLKLSRYAVTSKRELLKQVRRSWRSHGIIRRRGEPFISQSQIEATVNKFIDDIPEFLEIISNAKNK